MPFLPNTEGLKASVRLNLEWVPTVAHIYRGQFELLVSGQVTYDQFVENLENGFNQERTGVNRMWFDAFVGSRDRARSNERSIALVHLEALGEGRGLDDALWTKHLNLLETNLRDLDGFHVPATFHQLFDDRTFPEF